MAKKITYDIKGKVNGSESTSITLESSWQCVKKGSKYVYDTKPTEAKETISFTFWMPSGAKIKSAKVMFKKNNPASGISVLTVDKKSAKKSTAISVTVKSTSATISVPIVFRANGTKTNTSPHTSTLILSDIKLRIVYEEPAVMGLTTTELYKNYQNSFPIPAQGVCIYRQDTGTIYVFDGVTKVQHSISSKFEEEPDSHEDEYTNGARNEPDKVKIEVLMSDVYTTINNLTTAASRDDNQKTAMDAAAKALGFGEGSDSRSAAAYAMLYTLKAERYKLSIVTPQYIYVDMILGNVSVTWDNSSMYGWTGTLEFQHYYNTDSSDDSTSSTKKTTTDGDDDVDPSTLWEKIGSWFNKVKKIVTTSGNTGNS